MVWQTSATFLSLGDQQLGCFELVYDLLRLAVDSFHGGVLG
jgi:hypothetical protein